MSLERVIDKIKGTRYHIQMEVEDMYSRRPYEFSEFLYQPRDAGYLCFPRGFRWSKYATVNVIVPLKNSGRWALYFIKNIAGGLRCTLLLMSELRMNKLSNFIDKYGTLKQPLP